LQIKTKIVSSHAADSKPVKQQVNSTVILPPLVFLVSMIPIPEVSYVMELFSRWADIAPFGRHQTGLEKIVLSCVTAHSKLDLYQPYPPIYSPYTKQLQA
jgi:hypothetical protein